MLIRHTPFDSQNLRFVIFVVFLVFTVPVVAHAQCPVSTVSCIGQTCGGGEVEFYNEEFSTDPAHSVSVNRSLASYDLVNGRLFATANVDDVCKHCSRVIAVDRFELHNVAAAVLKIRLYISFYWMADPSGRMAWADGLAKLTVDCQSVVASSYASFIERCIELEITAIEGEPFDVIYETAAVAWGYYPSASMSCRLEFVNLPAGAEVTSCNGYGSSQVPVEQTTWGLVKTLYQ